MEVDSHSDVMARRLSVESPVIFSLASSNVRMVLISRFVNRSEQGLR